MSTRCQVRVENGQDKLTLYHHTDGYPTYMLPLIKKAWLQYGQGWEGARVYKVASMLCAIDPTVFEPLDYHKLHGDIEWFYSIDCDGESHVGAKPVWKVTVFKVPFSDSKPEDSMKTVGCTTIDVEDIEDYSKQLENKIV